MLRVNKIQQREEKVETKTQIKVWRATLGLSQEKFAELLDVHPNTVSNWESGKTRIDAETYKTIEKLVTDK